MIITHASYQVKRPDLDDPKAVIDIYRQIEEAGRTCYKSEKKGEFEESVAFVKKLIERKHEAMLEHVSMTVKFIVDRGISHELVRHRIASFAQESTRYCNYSKDKFGNEITVIEPVFFMDIPLDKRREMAVDINLSTSMSNKMPNTSNRHEAAYCYWYNDCLRAERSYFAMLDCGYTPEQARTVLPTSLKTEVIMTANLREWRHFLDLRAAGTTGRPHPQMLEVAVPLLNELRMKLPGLFDDIKECDIS